MIIAGVGAFLAPSAVSATAPTAAGSFGSLAPVRLLDTRSGNGVAHAGRIASGQTVTVTFAGQGNVPSTGVSAVVAAVTVVAPSSLGTLVVAPADAPTARATIINFAARQGITNTALLPLSATGAVSFTNTSPGSIDLVADATGYYLGGNPADNGAFGAVAPTRLLDTRAGNGAGRARVPAGGSITVTLAGRSPLPAAHVGAVVAAVTVVAPTTAGTLVTTPAGSGAAKATIVNFAARQGITDTAVLPLGTMGGSAGKVVFTNVSSGPIDIVADVSGYFQDGDATTAGTFGALAPVRLLDTRAGTGAPKARITAGHSITMTLGGRGGVPVTGVAAIVAAVTVVTPSTTGTLVVSPAGAPTAKATIINFTARQGITATAVLPVSPDGKVVLTNTSAGPIDLVADVAGFDLAAPGRPAGLTATPATTTIALAWTNPADTDLTGVVIRRAVGTTPPATPSAGTAVTQLGVGVTDFTDSTVNAGTQYAYAVFEQNGGNAFSAPATASVETTPNPSALTYGSPTQLVGPQGQPTGLSCPTATFCVAVDLRGAALVFDGTSWSSPVQTAKGRPLLSVSCSSPSFCVAGAVDGKVLTYDGSNWSSPTATPLDAVTAVSCSSPTSCLAYDSIASSHFDGTSWSPKVALPADSSPVVHTLACLTATLCVAPSLSFNDDTGEPSGGILTWNGTSWSAPITVVSGSALIALSCPSTTVCLATDFDGRVIRYNPTGKAHTTSTVTSGTDPLAALSCVPATTTCVAISVNGEAYRYNGTTWSHQVNVGPHDPIQVLSCASATTCVALDPDGYSISYSSTWASPVMADPEQGFPLDVSCATATACTAIDNLGHLYAYNGTTWGPTGSTLANAEALSCPSSTLCVGVGDDRIGIYSNGVLTQSASPLSDDEYLVDVSCPSSTFCMAVGDTGSVARYTGTTWVVTPVETGDEAGFVSVSCPSTTFCAAVDFDGRVLKYNGSTWSAPSMPAVGPLETISCTSAAFCAATLDGIGMAQYDGTTWTAASSHLPEGFGTSVSCASASFCVAIGSEGQASTFDGTSWSAAVMVNGGAPLVAVSCPSATTCAIVDLAGSVTLGTG
jgi:hypothetical protein